MKQVQVLLLLFVLSLLSDGVVFASEAVQEEEVVGTTDETVVDAAEEIVDLDDAAATEAAPETAKEEEASPEATEEDDMKTETEEETDSTTAGQSASEEAQQAEEAPVQAGPLVDLFGPTMLSLEMTSATTAQYKEHYTNDALRGKKVIGVYFSADWCGPCRQFTPELVSFYEKMNNRRGKKDEFEIVWISRCRDVQSFGQYFTQMPWIALPPQEAMGPRGEKLSQMFGVKSIPTLVLLDDMGSIITKDARNQIPKDKAGIGFPWRNPLSTLYMTLVPRSLRFMIKRELGGLKEKTVGKLVGLIGGLGKKRAAKA